MSERRVKGVLIFLLGVVTYMTFLSVLSYLLLAGMEVAG